MLTKTLLASHCVIQHLQQSQRPAFNQLLLDFSCYFQPHFYLFLQNSCILKKDVVYSFTICIEPAGYLTLPGAWSAKILARVVASGLLTQL